MTALGKIMVFVILVLSLVWNGLVVNAYVTRTNWKAEADKANKQAKQAADSATAMKALADSERDAAADSQRVLRVENGRLYDQVRGLTESNANLTKNYTALFAANNEAAKAAALYQSNVDKLTATNTNLAEQLARQEKAADALTKSEQAARIRAEEAQVAAEANRKLAEDRRNRIQELTEELENLRGSGGRPVTPGTSRPAAPSSFSGTVTFVGTPDRPGGPILLTLTPGGDAGLRAGTVLQVSRLSPNAKFVGRVTILTVDPKSATAQFTPPQANRPLRPDDLPRAGDLLDPDR